MLPYCFLAEAAINDERGAERKKNGGAWSKVDSGFFFNIVKTAKRRNGDWVPERECKQVDRSTHV